MMQTGISKLLSYIFKPFLYETGPSIERLVREKGIDPVVLAAQVEKVFLEEGKIAAIRKVRKLLNSPLYITKRYVDLIIS